MSEKLASGNLICLSLSSAVQTKKNYKLVQGTFITILTGYISSSKFLILYFLLFAAW